MRSMAHLKVGDQVVLIHDGEPRRVRKVFAVGIHHLEVDGLRGLFIRSTGCSVVKPGWRISDDLELIAGAEKIAGAGVLPRGAAQGSARIFRGVDRHEGNSRSN